MRLVLIDWSILGICKKKLKKIEKKKAALTSICAGTRRGPGAVFSSWWTISTLFSGLSSVGLRDGINGEMPPVLHESTTSGVNAFAPSFSLQNSFVES